MAWRVADSLEVLLAEVNHRWPGRDKTSDGSIGDTSHQARPSDHNPTVKDDNGIGVVRARDFDKDGIDPDLLAETVRLLGQAGDPRVKYVIWNRRIASWKQNFAWRPYTGANPHDHHIHISVSDEQVHYDSILPWGIHPVAPPPPTEEGFMSALTEAEQREALEILRALQEDYLTKGQSVRQLIVHTDKTVTDIASGKRPVKP